MRISIPIDCKECKKKKGYKSQLYTPKDINNIPDKPIAKCNHCGRYILINRSYVIDFLKKVINKNNKTFWSSVAKHSEKNSLVLRNKILKYLNKRLNGYQISKKMGIHHSKIYKEINWFLKYKLITPYPISSNKGKTYKLSSAGKFYITSGKLPNFKSILKMENYDRELKQKPNWVLNEYIHHLSFYQELIKLPKWIKNLKPIRVRNKYKRYKEEINNITVWVKPIQMRGWIKYNVYLPSYLMNRFGGIECIELTKDKAVYDFNREKEECKLTTSLGFLNYFTDRENNCKECNIVLDKLGITIDKSDPLIFRKPHIVINSKGEIKDLRELGKYVRVFIKGTNEEIQLDSSQDEFGEFEETDPSKAFDQLDLPNRIDDLDDKINKLDDIINNQSKQEQKINKIEKALIILANDQNKLVNQFGTLTKQMKVLNTNLTNLLGLGNDQKQKNKKEFPNYYG